MKTCQNISIVGAGFTGMSARFYLSKSRNKVTLFESRILPGGLALGFKDPNWDWILENHYHHFNQCSKSICNTQTPVKGLYLANIQKVYLLDRGTNYAA